MKQTTKEELECLEAYNRFERERIIGGEQYAIPYTTPPLPEDPTQIANYGLPKSERKFPYYDLNQLNKAISSDLKIAEKIFKEEEEKRYNGLWFYNGDNLEYVTGDHYMFLQYWTVSGTIQGKNGEAIKGLRQPDFIDMQRDLQYAWQAAKENKDCFGIIFVGRRRTAKTELAMNNGYWHTTSREAARFAIQSKTEKDADKIMARIVLAWQKLPFIWKPTDAGLTNVKKKLEFREPTRRTSKDKRKIYQDVLNSEISSHPPSDVELDGEYFSLILNDEIYKTEKRVSDVVNRWYVNKKCLMDGTSIVGKAFLTSTVEETEKDTVIRAKKLWEDSKYPKRDKETNRTTSGLWALFFPAYYGFTGEWNGVPLVDEWGYSNQDLAREYIEKTEYGNKEGQDLVKEKRRHPFDEYDAFYTDSAFDVFPQVQIRQQLKYNDISGESQALVRRGNFYWEDGVRLGNVFWKDDPNGRWLRAKDCPIDMRCQNTLRGGQKTPIGDVFFTGVDPVDHGKVRDGKGSTMVAYTLAKSDPRVGTKHILPVCRYSYRHDNPYLGYEDILMQVIYYSSHLLAENQKGGINWWFKDKGFDGYCMYDPTETDLRRKFRGDKGMPTTGKETGEYMIRITKSYVAKYVGYREETNDYNFFPWDELLNDMLAFNPTNRTAFDDTMAFMIAMCAISDINRRKIIQDAPRNYLPPLRMKTRKKGKFN